MNILLVVHRTYPYPGGSEYLVKVVSEELDSRGHNVTILTDVCDLNYTKINITTDRTELFNDKYDWIIIHGSDMPTQNFALDNIQKLKSKVFYWIIFPSNSKSAMNGLYNANKLGYGTSFDLDHIKKFNLLNKSYFIRYSIDSNDCIGRYGFKTKYNITTDKMILASAKNSNQLITHFRNNPIENTTLVTCGYYPQGTIDESNIKTFSFNNRQDYLDALIESDYYISNSLEEGFGLVILDCMLNKIPWFFRHTGGGLELYMYGNLFTSMEDLFYKIRNCDINKVNLAYDYVISNRLSKNIGDDFENALK
jgi:glycosyltransferase involved in cell wall biosynthesis